jgi:hypothetical protein
VHLLRTYKNSKKGAKHGYAHPGIQYQAPISKASARKQLNIKPETVLTIIGAYMSLE